MNLLHLINVLEITDGDYDPILKEEPISLFSDLFVEPTLYTNVITEHEKNLLKRLGRWIKVKVAKILAYLAIPILAILPYRPTNRLITWIRRKFRNIHMLPYDHTKTLIAGILIFWTLIWCVVIYTVLQSIK